MPRCGVPIPNGARPSSGAATRPTRVRPNHTHPAIISLTTPVRVPGLSARHVKARGETPGTAPKKSPGL